MNKTDLTTAFEQTSFLYGGNAQFIEQLYAKYLENPAAVDQHWRQFFAGLEDNAEQAKAQVERAVLAAQGLAAAGIGRSRLGARRQLAGRARRSPPRPARAKAAEKPPGLSAEDVRKATMDSVRALMMIRAYRMRGHLAADLDPLKLKEPEPHPELDPASYGFTRSRHGPADLPRQGAGPRTRHGAADRRHPEAHLLRHAGRRVHAYFRPRAEGLDPGAHRRRRQGDQLHAGRQEGDPRQAHRRRRLRAFPQCEIYRHQALRPRRRRSR